MKSKAPKSRGKSNQRKTGKPLDNPPWFAPRPMTPAQMERLVQQQIKFWGIRI